MAYLDHIAKRYVKNRISLRKTACTKVGKEAIGRSTKKCKEPIKREAQKNSMRGGKAYKEPVLSQLSDEEHGFKEKALPQTNGKEPREEGA